MDTAQREVLGLRKVRTEYRITMAQAGKLLGYDASQICRIESGQRALHNPRLAASLLGVSYEYLIEDCRHCGYQPPSGYRCLRCGCQGSPPPPPPPRHTPADPVGPGIGNHTPAST